MKHSREEMQGLTLDIGNALLQDLLQDLGVLQLLLDLGNNGSSELLLLALLNLTLVANPGIEDGLGLSGQSSLLFQLECLSLKLGGFLKGLLLAMPFATFNGLGDVNNTAHLLDTLNAGLDGLGVVGASAVKDVLDLLVLGLGPLLVGRATVLDEATPDGEQADGDDGLLVDDVVLVADGVDAQGGGAAEDGGLAEQAAAGESIDDALGLLLGVLGGHVARVAHGSAGHGREGSAGKSRSEEGSAYSQGQSQLRGRSRANWRLPGSTRGSRRTDGAGDQAGGHFAMVSNGVSTA
ncbi:nucleolar complex protein [Paramyrothecium foliicola]|nr:nucleolar complex protein [Paramyrothecium foliicola]